MYCAVKQGRSRFIPILGQCISVHIHYSWPFYVQILRESTVSDAFYNTSCCQDVTFNIVNQLFHAFIKDLCIQKLYGTYSNDQTSPFLDPDLTIHNNNISSPRYDKRGLLTLIKTA